MILSKKYVRNGKVTVKFGKRYRLTALDCCPKKIAGYFDCSFNKLTTLKSARKKLVAVIIALVTNSPR